MKQGKKTNVDNAAMEQMRQAVVEQELSARSWKAYYEKMYYSLEAEKLEPEYRKYQERVQERLKQEREAFEKFQSSLQEQMDQMNEQDPVGEIKLEEAN